MDAHFLPPFPSFCPSLYSYHHCRSVSSIDETAISSLYESNIWVSVHAMLFINVLSGNNPMFSTSKVLNKCTHYSLLIYE